MSQLFKVKQPKGTYERWFIDVGISNWLNGETIQSANFTAKEQGTNTDVSATFLDQGKCTNTATVLKPYVRAGTSGKVYLVFIRVVTVETSYGEFIIEVSVRDY